MYAKLNNGIIEYAPSSIKTADGKYILNPQESNYNEHGYFLIEYKDKPALKSGETYIENYSFADNKILVTYQVLPPNPVNNTQEA